MARGRYCALWEGRGQRERGKRKGERWVMDLGEAALASPSSSPWQLIPRLSGSLKSCSGWRRRWEGGLRTGEGKRAASAETIAPSRGTLSSEVITVEQATGHCSAPRCPTESYCSTLHRPRAGRTPNTNPHIHTHTNTSSSTQPQWVNILPHVMLEGLKNGFTDSDAAFKEKCCLKKGDVMKSHHF